MSNDAFAGKLEVEVKVRLLDRSSFAAKLPLQGFRLLTPDTMERNILFDTPEGNLRDRREILRIRKYGEIWKLTHKADAGKPGTSTHKVRIETELEISDGQALTEILERLGYQQVFVYEKRREEWTDGVGHLVLDVTPIGDFAELEGDHVWIDATAKKLGILPSEYSIASYTRLFSDWKSATKHPANNMTFDDIGVRSASNGPS
jgi:adenylate cyclase class 2